MKRIFAEISEPVTVAVKWHNEETGHTHTERLEIGVSTTAHYDANLHVLVVDQAMALVKEHYSWLKGALLWELPARRTLETYTTTAQAIRRAIALADDYADRLSKTAFDDERTDTEVKAEYWGELAA